MGIDRNLPPLLLLHGFGASLGHWRYNLPTLSQQHTVYALDMIGFGASEKVSTNYDFFLWADQLYDFWRTFLLQPTILVGNSIGSLVSMAAAAKYPEMVKGMVMINLPDTSVLQPPPGLRPVLSTLKYGLQPVLELTKRLLTWPLIFVPVFRILRNPKVLKPWAQKAYADPTLVNEELVHLFAQPCYDRGAAMALRHMINSKASQTRPVTAKSILPQLNIPMLLMWGNQDMMVPPKLAPLFTQYNPRLRLIQVENAGHCPHDECPEQVNQAILHWIDSQHLNQSSTPHS